VNPVRYKHWWCSVARGWESAVTLPAEAEWVAMSTVGAVTVTFAGSGDAFGSGGRYQACIHLQGHGFDPFLLDCGASSLPALKRLGLSPNDVGAVVVSHLHGDHFGGLPFLILDGHFARRTKSLTVAGPAGISPRLHDAMECLFPGSSTIPRRFGIDIVELHPGSVATIAGATISAFEVEHPSGAPPLALRLDLGAKRISYTGDTAWTDALIEVTEGADLLIAEAYYRDKYIPYHLRQSDLAAHRDQLHCRRIVITHMSTDMLDHPDDVRYDTARDGLVITI
jgi:ribonuclease BN (tRNA processing enzyme)